MIASSTKWGLCRFRVSYRLEEKWLRQARPSKLGRFAVLKFCSTASWWLLNGKSTKPTYRSLDAVSEWLASSIFLFSFFAWSLFCPRLRPVFSPFSSLSGQIRSRGSNKIRIGGCRIRTLDLETSNWPYLSIDTTKAQYNWASKPWLSAPRPLKLATYAIKLDLVSQGCWKGNHLNL